MLTRSHPSGPATDAHGDAVVRQTLVHTFDELMGQLNSVVTHKLSDETVMILDDPGFLSSSMRAKIPALGVLLCVFLVVAGSFPAPLSPVFLEACINTSSIALEDEYWLSEVAPEDMAMFKLLPEYPRDLVVPTELTQVYCLLSSLVLKHSSLKVRLMFLEPRISSRLTQYNCR